MSSTCSSIFLAIGKFVRVTENHHATLGSHRMNCSSASNGPTLTGRVEPTPVAAAEVVMHCVIPGNQVIHVELPVRNSRCEPRRRQSFVRGQQSHEPCEQTTDQRVGELA